MPQRQCRWCGRLGDRVEEQDLRLPSSAPHADGSKCICRHVEADTRAAAIADHGRYWDGYQYQCFGGCGTGLCQCGRPATERVVVGWDPVPWADTVMDVFEWQCSACFAVAAAH